MNSPSFRTHYSSPSVPRQPKNTTPIIHPANLSHLITSTTNINRFKGYGSDSDQELPRPVSPFKILVVLDYNGTLNRNFTGIIRVLQKYRNNLVVLINTGRSLGWIQQDVKKRKEQLKALPVDVLATHDGTEFYQNTASKRFPKWLTSLTPHSQDREWVQDRAALSGWHNIPMIRTIINEVASSVIDFYTSKFPNKKVKVYNKDPGDPKFYVGSTSDSINEIEHTFKAELTRKLTDESLLPTHSIQTDIIVEDGPTGSDGQSVKKFILKPKNYTKKTPIEFTLKKDPSIAHVITAGNGANDVDMLKPAHISGQPNHGFVCKGGKDEQELRESLTQKPHIKFITQTSLDSELESEIVKILKTKPIQS